MHPRTQSPTPVADYDSFAAAYSASNDSNLFNAYYARPEMIRLAGDVAGLQVYFSTPAAVPAP